MPQEIWALWLHWTLQMKEGWGFPKVRLCEGALQETTDWGLQEGCVRARVRAGVHE